MTMRDEALRGWPFFSHVMVGIGMPRAVQERGSKFAPTT